MTVAFDPDLTPAARHTASVVISTHNRKKDLQAAVASVLAQTEPVELIVIDDGSSDGTAEMIAEHYPQVRLVRHEVSRGYIVRRNEGATLASGTILFSIDDDAVFSTPHVMRQILRHFDSARIGAVAIPFVDVRKGSRMCQQAPDAGAVYCTEAFVGTAHAVRRDVFLGVGGYREALVHQGEEGDVCLRMLDAGFVVRLGWSDPIHHFESPKRNLKKMDHYGARNSVLFAWQNVPLPYVLVRLPGTTLRCLFYAWQPRRFAARLVALVKAVRDCRLYQRAPVSKGAYHAYRIMRPGAPKTLEEIEPWLHAARTRQDKPVLAR